jgi:hypothetical protein
VSLVSSDLGTFGLRTLMKTPKKLFGSNINVGVNVLGVFFYTPIPMGLGKH